MNEDILDVLGGRESEMLMIRLMANVSITSVRLDEYIRISLLQGRTAEEIEKALLEDLNNGGRIFGEFRNSIKATAHGNIRRISDVGQYAFQGMEKAMRWITVQDQKVCPDCMPRHNQSATMEAWEFMGLPRTGWSVCRDNCRCVLVDSQLDLPVIERKRR
jgi:hypothetical protein